jgi:phosphoserine phosphatase
MATPPPFTLVLTAAPGSDAASDAVLSAAKETLGSAWTGAHRLAPGTAWDIPLTVADGAGASSAREAVARAIGILPIDVNIVRNGPESRRKRLLCADMESTIIEQELIDEMAGLVGCQAEISAITAAALRGELDFEGSVVKRVALFAGLEVPRLEAILARATPMPGAANLVATMRAHGARTALISGGFTIFAERIGAALGFDAVAANVLEIENGRLTGRVREPILGPEGKARALKRLAAEGGIALPETLAVGDGANDVAMLAAAGLGVAFRAKPILADRARALETGAVIAHGDLTALLHLQGYAHADFAP